MTEKPWHERMNDEYGAAKTPAARKAVLAKYMSDDQTRVADSHLSTGAPHGVRDESKGRRPAR